ncbi:MAG TPA: HlyD family efflux transporter periplasmic adaptor subunit [Candidatus Polarisedimenticolaceae bacterium]|nr:HlyD family efflux transporter periplasmic adaptor subunit [Candidatus Polarisedimenticolaceae bacterium]
MKRFWLTAAIAGSLAAGCSAGHADPSSAARRAAPGDLRVVRGRFEDRFLLTGALDAVRADQLVVPRIPSWETTIRWMEDEGTIVKAGQRVVEFDTAAFAADLGEKRLAYDQADADLERAQADQDGALADAEFQVAQKAIAAEKARIAAEIPEEFLRGKDWQENQMALERAKTDLEKAKEDLEAKKVSSAETVHQKRIAQGKARRELEAATAAMDGMVLKAPRDGILVVAEHPWQGRKLQVGDSVWVGMPIVSLPDLDQMQVRAKLSDVDDGRIAPQLPVVCTLDAYPDRTFAGRIAEITPVAQEEIGRSLRRAYNVTVDLEQGDSVRMRPGMSVKVDVRPPPREAVLLAPREGLDFAGPTPRARLDAGGEVDVTLGACNREACIVLSGLTEGARLRPAA